MVKPRSTGAFVKYFAYGSNMLKERLRARVPGAVRLSNADVTGYDLRFNKKSVDGSGKANITKTGNKIYIVHGALFEIPEAQRQKLDDAEGPGYADDVLPGLLPHDPATPSLVYIAKPEFIDDTLVPYSWYLDPVVAGAEQNGFPAEYIARLKQHPANQDPNPNRKAKLEAEKALAEATPSWDRIRQSCRSGF